MPHESDIIYPHEMAIYPKINAQKWNFNRRDNEDWISIIQDKISSSIQAANEKARFMRDCAKKHVTFDIMEYVKDKKLKDFIGRIYYAGLDKQAIMNKNDKSLRRKSLKRNEPNITTPLQVRNEITPTYSVVDSEPSTSGVAHEQPTPTISWADTVEDEESQTDTSEDEETAIVPQAPLADYIAAVPPSFTFEEMINDMNSYFERQAIAIVGWDARKGTSHEELIQKIANKQMELALLYNALAHRRYCHKKGINYPHVVIETFEEYNKKIEDLQIELGKLMQHHYDFIRIENIIMAYRQAAKHV